eukprot:2392302-Amphidinium_carterae.4
MQQDAHTRVHRAMKAQNRVSEQLKIGDWVYVLRSNRLNRKWREGPAVVTMLAGASTWVSLRGALYKVATINVRKATEDETKSVRTLNELLPELQSTAMEQRGRRRCVDVTREQPWDAHNEDSTAVPSQEQSRRPSTVDTSDQPPMMPRQSSSSSQLRTPSTPRAGLSEPSQNMPAESASADHLDASMPSSADIPDPAQAAQSAAINLRAVRRGRSPSAPRRVRSKVSGEQVQAHVDRIESALARSVTPTEVASPSLQQDAVTPAEMEVGHVYTWTTESDLWTAQAAQMYFNQSDPDNDVPFRKLEAHELDGFAKAMEKEASSMMIDNKALVPLSLEESRQVRNHKSECILPSRWHFKRKTVETPEGIVKNPKARWILLGHKDSAAVQLGETSYAPTPSLLTINIALQALASAGRKAGTAGFSAAFLQANETSREVYVSQPPEGVPGLDEQVLLRMKVEIYGSTAGPTSWRNTLVPYLKELGYKQSVYDQCLFILPPADIQQSPVISSSFDVQHLMHDTGESLVSHGTRPKVLENKANVDSDIRAHEGLIVLLVDDILEGGGVVHDECMTKLKQRFNLGKHVKLARGALFNGRRLTQNSQGDIKCSMKDYIDDELERLDIPKKKRGDTEKRPPKDSDIPLNAAQCQLLRTVTAKLLWVARQGRPDVLGCSSFLSQVKEQRYTMEHLRDAARAIAHLKQTADLAFTIHAIRPQDIQTDHRGQGGVLIGFTTSALQQGHTAPVSPIAWRGGRLDRVVNSSLAAEAYALQGGVAMAELCNNVWLEASNARWSLTWARHNLGQWESGMQRSTTGVLAARADCSSPLLESVCVTDAKSLYDSLKREAKSREPRVAVAVAELKQGLSVLNLGIRWIPHQAMVCDGFTKCFGQGHLSPLLTLLRSGHAKLVAEDDLLENRKLERVSRG